MPAFEAQTYESARRSKSVSVSIKNRAQRDGDYCENHSEPSSERPHTGMNGHSHNLKKNTEKYQQKSNEAVNILSSPGHASHPTIDVLDDVHKPKKHGSQKKVNEQPEKSTYSDITASSGMQAAVLSKFDRSPASLVFSTDGKFLLVTSTNCVEVISVLSGKQILTLEGHKLPVTDIALHPFNSVQAFTCSLDGTLRLWDFSDGSAIKKWNLGLQARHVVVSQDGNTVYASLFKHSSHPSSCKKPTTHIHRIDLASGKQQQLFTCRGVARLSLHDKSRTLLAVAGKDLWVWKEPNGRDSESNLQRFEHARYVEVVVAHPEGKYVATADDRGEIFLWRNVISAQHDFMETDEGQAKRLPFCSKSSMHWHAHAVRCLGTSVDGACLVSGGEEGVLVQWQVDTGHKNFLPRLGGPINSLAMSPCGTLAAVLCEGHLVQVVNLLTRKVAKTIRMLSAALAIQGTCVSLDLVMGGQCSLLGVEPHSGHVILNPSGTSVQVWDALNNKHVMQVEITPRNWVSRTFQKNINAPRVQHVCFSSDGTGMAAVHGRDGAEGESGLSQLTFWALHEGEFCLQTRVEFPHGDKVKSLAYSPEEHLVLSAGTDRQFKLWERVTRELTPRPDGPGVRGGGLDQTWRCRAVGSLRPKECSCVAFSRDGSVFATGYGSTTGLWTTEDMRLKSSLTNSAVKETVRSLHFMAGGPFLVTVSASTVAIWSLTAQAMCWCYDACAVAVAVHPSRSLLGMALSGPDGLQLLVCDAASPEPMAAWRRPHGWVPWLAFAWSADGGASQDQARLVVVGSAGKFVSLSMDGGQDEGKEAGLEPREYGGHDEADSAYSRIFPPAHRPPAHHPALSSTRRERRPPAKCGSGLDLAAAGKGLVDGPSHVLAAPRLLVGDFMRAVAPPPAMAGSSVAVKGGVDERWGSGAPREGELAVAVKGGVDETRAGDEGGRDAGESMGLAWRGAEEGATPSHVRHAARGEVQASPAGVEAEWVREPVSVPDGFRLHAEVWRPLETPPPTLTKPSPAVKSAAKRAT